MSRDDQAERLRDLFDTIPFQAPAVALWDALKEAARIGAEYEREACAMLADDPGDPTGKGPCDKCGDEVAGIITDVIRARGGK
jgi:hypothetical protein